MRIKVRKIVDEIAAGLRKIPCVEMVSMVSDIENIYDPYFSIKIDVFCTDILPSVEERHKTLPDNWLFETRLSTKEDYVVVKDLPISINYSFTSSIDNILKEWEGDSWIYSPGETNLLYRFTNGESSFSRTGWGERVIEELDELPGIFWSMLQISLLAQLEQNFSSMLAAEMKEDELFFSVSLIDFLRCYTSMMFAVNEQFEPDEKIKFDAVQELTMVPEHFKTEYLGLFSVNQGYTMARKLEVAKILLAAIAPMV